MTCNEYEQTDSIEFHLNLIRTFEINQRYIQDIPLRLLIFIKL